MSFSGLLHRNARIIRRTQSGAPDRYNRPTFTEQAVSNYPCYLEQTRGKEVTAGREAQVGDHLLILPPGALLDGSDRVEIDGITYEVIGPPWAVQRPSSGTHHIEALLREVTG